MRPTANVAAAAALVTAMLSLPATVDAADEPLRVCSITINSDDEIRAFREHLPASEFEFVELTSLGSPREVAAGEPEWLAATCERRLRCDVLVVSGHFSDTYAGSFGTTFAGDTGLSLALERLEGRRCEQSCPGLLEAPLEVFLFGCRTLATGLEGPPLSAADRALFAEHGVSGETADAILAEIRHDGEETSNERRMRFVFAGVPRIYGFSWTAPTGGPTAPLLGRYFDRVGDYAAHLRELRRARSEGRAPGPNRALARSMTLGSFTQTLGFGSSDPELRRDAQSCVLQSPSHAPAERLERAEALLDGSGLLTHLGGVTELLGSLEDEPLGAAEKSSIERLRGHAPSRRGALDLARNLAEPSIRLAAIRLAEALGWMDDRAVLGARRDVVLDLLRPPTYGEGRDLVCGLDEQTLRRIDVRAGDLTEDVYGDEYAIAALACLEPEDPEIHARLGRTLSDEREWVARAAAQTLRALAPVDVRVQLDLVRQLARREQDLRASVEEAIREIEPADPEVVSAIRATAPSFPIDWL